ncbi:MAG: VCBS repeat-containing protein [Oscillospiraceae bacterium]|nr:VCBS repeat-containing protein [Oscillospiraceae bacterium]
MAIKFEKKMLDIRRFEAACVFDVNNDGVLDIVCGEYWYEGPKFEKLHRICHIGRSDDCFYDFSDYGMDVDGDGFIDIITGSWHEKNISWRKNPGNDNDLWIEHLIDNPGFVETIRFIDIDGCGFPEVIPNTPENPQHIYKLDRNESGKGTGLFKKYIISSGKSRHGMGFGDINNDGKIDIILSNGWLEQPVDGPYNSEWIFHDEGFDFGSASVPILSLDITGNGLLDLIVGKAHDYGLAWYEQIISSDNKRKWVIHDIDNTVSQYHDMCLADIDNDGEPELITGKRYWAHKDKDPGSYDPLGLYYFKINKGKFEKHVIDYGRVCEASGCGIYMWIADLDGNGLLDIVAPGNDGLFLFKNLGNI